MSPGALSSFGGLSRVTINAKATFPYFSRYRMARRSDKTPSHFHWMKKLACEGQRPPPSASLPSSTPSPPSSPPPLHDPQTPISLDEFTAMVRSRGLELSVSEIGPAFRIFFYLPETPSGDASISPSSSRSTSCPSYSPPRDADDGRVVGWIEGFTVPFLRLIHMDKMVIVRGDSLSTCVRASRHGGVVRS